MHSISLSDFDHLPDTSKVWVYFSDRAWSEVETNTIQSEIQGFCTEWTSHGNQVQSAFKILYHQIIILVVDEASGCSTDSSVRFISTLQTRHSCNLMNRNLLTYLKSNNNIGQITLDQISSLSPDTEVFNPFYQDLAYLKRELVQKISDSKYKRLYKV